MGRYDRRYPTLQRGHTDEPGIKSRSIDSIIFRSLGSISNEPLGGIKVVGSQYRSAAESLSFSIRHSMDQQPMVGRIQTKNQSRIER